MALNVQFDQETGEPKRICFEIRNHIKILFAVSDGRAVLDEITTMDMNDETTRAYVDPEDMKMAIDDVFKLSFINEVQAFGRVLQN